MRIVFLLVLVIAPILSAAAQGCSETAKIVPPAITEAARKVYEAKLEEAEAEVARNPKNADAHVWLGRRTAYLGRYREAIGIFTRGAEMFPKDARFLRHRGHRLITLRCFDDAVRDLESAAKLVKGKPDEIEPDGLPNARNTPTSTLQSNIFYHLGLAFYLKGDFKRALKAYRKCVAVSTNPDMLVAAKHWEYMTLRRIGRVREAERSVVGIGDALDIIENDDYYKMVKLYQGKIPADELARSMGADADSLGIASLGYGLGNWYHYIGETEKGIRIFRMVIAGNQWASFGYIASEAELARPVTKSKRR
ncbi:MAG: tetratricopeptide repeat protein [Acidobacteria bacterium]|nr:tetratricopeptide repeat protein [Acidobacteriota bacterium]